NKYLDQINEIGGAVKAVEEGYMQREIQRTAYETQKNIENEEEIIVGLNQYKLNEKVNPELLKVDEALETEKITILEPVSKERNQNAVDNALAALREHAQDSNVNLIPHILHAVKVYATVGEICNVLREEFGEYTGM